MNWSNVRLIFFREVRDQLRDRRTLFTIAILPLVLYPLMGMTFLQVAQFTHEQPAPVWVLGAAQLPAAPPLVDGGRFQGDCCPADEARLLPVDLECAAAAAGSGRMPLARATAAVQSGQYAVAIVFPAGFADAWARFRASPQGAADQDGQPAFPSPEVVFDAASDRSRIAAARVRRALENWRGAIVRQYLADRALSPHITEPFDIGDVDISQELTRRAAFWSKVLPFVVFVWALTGAFYPAVDLCAGEKERGTLETLLSSPAGRGEIVGGKLLTIMCFSAATSLLNLVSLAATGTAVIGLQPTMFPIGPPPLAALGWLILALLPVSALFSASALAIAAFARSTKEGQYYLMPLLLICLPLLMLPLLPAVTLNLGTSLIPVSGILLLLRNIVEGQYAEAAWFAPPVLLVTGACCLFVTRWAVDQFHNESVLFRESERLDLGLWLRHVVRDRGPTPTVGQACACGVLLLLVRFFAGFAMPAPRAWRDLAVMQSLTQIVLLAGPVLLLTPLLTRSVRATLLLRPVRLQAVARGIVLAIAIHPVALRIAAAIQALYPLSENVAAQLQDLQRTLVSGPGFGPTILLLACLPAVCEELAFRGFILSGFRARGSKWGAMIASSALFGATHGILQQSLGAALVGMVIAYLAVQTGSLLPGIAFHMVYNTLSLLPLSAAARAADHGLPWWSGWLTIQGGSVSYGWPALAAGTAISLWMLRWYARLSPEDGAVPQPDLAASRRVADVPLS